MKFDFDIDREHVKNLEAKGESPAGYYRDIVKQEQSCLQEYTKFLRLRQDIQQYVHRLTISRGKHSFDIVLSRAEQDSFIPRSMYDMVSDTIPHFTSLQLLVLKDWELSERLMLRLQHLTTLRTLVVRDCTFVSPALPTSMLPSIRNLFLRVSDVELLESEYLIDMCPALENLSISLRIRNSDPGPFDGEVNPFGTLRKFHYGPVRNLVTFTALTSNIADAMARSPHGRIPLTHLKISFEIEINRDELFDFIDLLGSTSLESLVLFEISYVGLDLLERLARALPNLLELTLIKSTLNYSGLCEWGPTPWEYALSFPYLARLRYFVWNINHPGDSYTPRCLLGFEQENCTSCDEDENFTTDEDVFILDEDDTISDEDSPTSSEDASASDEDESISDADRPVLGQDDLTWDEDYQSGLELIAKALHRRCPSLEYMVLRPHIEDEAYTYRRRDYNGEIYFEHSEVDSRLMWERNPPKGWDYYKERSTFWFI